MPANRPQKFRIAAGKIERRINLEVHAGLDFAFRRLHSFLDVEFLADKRLVEDINLKQLALLKIV